MQVTNDFEQKARLAALDAALKLASIQDRGLYITPAFINHKVVDIDDMNLGLQKMYEQPMELKSSDECISVQDLLKNYNRILEELIH